MARPKNKEKTKVIFKRVHPSIYKQCLDFIANQKLIVNKIDASKLKVGSILVAKDACIMDNSSYLNNGQKALIVGKEYILNRFNNQKTWFMIESEVSNEHLFDIETIDDFFIIKQY